MKVIIAGATTNPARYAYIAAEMLQEYKFDFVPVGIKKGEVFSKKILDIRQRTSIEGVDTITMYMNAGNQQQYYEYFLQLHPRRIIFNPGAENPELRRLAEAEGIVVQEACTLVMLRLGHFDKY